MTLDPAGPDGTNGVVIITGNLQVEGTTTTINSNTVTTNDLVISVANNAINGAAANGGGFGGFTVYFNGFRIEAFSFKI